jgi:hypothetical protein
LSLAGGKPVPGVLWHSDQADLQMPKDPYSLMMQTLSPSPACYRAAWRKLGFLRAS